MKPKITLPKHPARGPLRVLGVIAWVLLAFGLLIALASPIQGLFIPALAALMVWVVRRGLAQVDAVQALSLAQQALVDNDVEKAEAMLALVPKKGRFGSVPRADHITRAMLAQRRARFEEAEQEATKAIESGPARMQRAFQQHQIALAHSHRALARVALGSLDAALADAHAAEANPDALPEALARARLVTGVVLSRNGKYEELLAHMTENASLFAEHATPKERATARALRKLAGAKTRKAIYREPAPPLEEKEPDPLAGFVSVLAPGAEAFVDRRPTANQTLSAPTASPRALAQGNTYSGGLAAPVGVLTLAFIAGMALIHGRGPVPEDAEPTFATSTLPMLLVLFGGVVAVAIFMKQNDGSALLLSHAQRLFALGRISEAHAELTALSNRREPVTSSNAKLGLAKLAIRNGAFDDAIGLCHAAIRALNAPLVRGKVSDALLPSVVGELAVAYAATGKSDLAEGHLATLAREFAVYPHLSTYLFRVRLLEAVRASDFDRARDVVATRTAEMPLPRRDELLADLVQATGVTSNDERERIAAELSEERPLRKWIDKVAPGLCDRALAEPRQVAHRVASEAALGSTDASTADPRVHDDGLHAEADSAGGDEKARAR